MRPSVVDFAATARRLRRVLVVLAVVTVAGWPLAAAARGTGLELRLLGELVGWALLIAFVAELVVVGGSALRGMLRAGQRGDRLARNDVSLIPPQLQRRRAGGPKAPPASREAR